MTKIKNLVGRLETKSGGRLRSHFIEEGSSFVIKV
jgi:hypothetical protein